jgi:hypothetical protein
MKKGNRKNKVKINLMSHSNANNCTYMNEISIMSMMFYLCLKEHKRKVINNNGIDIDMKKATGMNREQNISST